MAAFIPVDVCPLKKIPQIRAGMQMEHDFSVRSNKKFSEINGIAEKVVLFFFFPEEAFPMEICVPFTDFSHFL